MSLRRKLRTNVVDKLPRKPRFFIERVYNRFNDPSGHITGDLAVLKMLCKPDKAAVDVGASCGTVTLHLCKYAQHVYCFEPIQTAADYLREKFSGCNVTVENCALGNVDGRLTLKIPYAGAKKIEPCSSIVKDFKNETIMGERITSIEEIDIICRRLDSFMIKNIGLIKIDVEGFELEVLKGGENTIERERPNLFIEIEKRHHKDGKVQQVFKWLDEWNYVAHYVYKKSIRSIMDFDFAKMQNEQFENSSEYINDFVFTPVEFSSSIQ